MTVLSFVSAVNSALLNSTVTRWGSRSSLSETGMTFSLLLNYASSHMGVKSDCYASGITQLAEREPWMASWMPATGTYHSRTLFEARNGYDPRWLGLHRSGTAVPVLKAKNPAFAGFIVFRIRSLAVFYSHMGRPHTTIDANVFHF